MNRGFKSFKIISCADVQMVDEKVENYEWGMLKGQNYKLKWGHFQHKGVLEDATCPPRQQTQEHN